MLMHFFLLLFVKPWEHEQNKKQAKDGWKPEFATELLKRVAVSNTRLCKIQRITEIPEWG